MASCLPKTSWSTSMASCLPKTSWKRRILHLSTMNSCRAWDWNRKAQAGDFEVSQVRAGKSTPYSCRAWDWNRKAQAGDFEVSQVRAGKSTPYVQRLVSSSKKTKRRVRRFVGGFLRPLPPSEPTLYVSALKVFCRGNGSCRRLGGLPPTLALKNGEAAVVFGRRDAKKKKSPLRLKAESEDFRGCTPQNNDRVSPVNSGGIWSWASMFGDVKPT